MRLIDADALEPFYESGTDPDDSYADMTFIRAERVEDAPTVEAEPVRHGYWIIRGGDMWCSECGYGDVTEFGEPEDYRYCPHCGTRMGE